MDEGSGQRNSEAALKQLELYIGVYKQHFDLFLKGTVLYVAVVGAIAGYVFTSGLDRPLKAGLSLIIAMGSLVALAGFHVSRKWVLDLEQRVHEMEQALGLKQFPFSGAKGVASVMTATSLLFLAAGCGHALWFLLW